MHRTAGPGTSLAPERGRPPARPCRARAAPGPPAGDGERYPRFLGNLVIRLRGEQSVRMKLHRAFPFNASGKFRVRVVSPILDVGIFLALSAFLVLNSCDDEVENPFCPHGQVPPYSASTLIGGLYGFCFSDSIDCECYSVDLLLYLDTANLPSNRGANNYPLLVLSSRPPIPVVGSDRLGFDFSGTGTLPLEIDPGALDQSGWKVEIADATIHYCRVCLNNCGLVPVISLHGSLDNVEFRYDPMDTLAIYIDREHR